MTHVDLLFSGYKVSKSVILRSFLEDFWIFQSFLIMGCWMLIFTTKSGHEGLICSKLSILEGIGAIFTPI